MWTSDSYELQEAARRQLDIVEMYVVLLTTIAFGPLCPLLYLAALIFVGTNICSVYWIRTKARRTDTHLQRLADKVVVQHPKKIFSFLVVFTQWFVATGVFVE